MAFKTVSNIYGIINANGQISNATTSDIAGGPNGTAYFEGANVVAVLPFDGSISGYTITGGSRVILNGNGNISGYASSKTVAQMVSAVG
jgi:hypothetical protein